MTESAAAQTPDEYPMCGPCFVFDHLACRGDNCGCGYCADMREDDDDPK